MAVFSSHEAYSCATLFPIQSHVHHMLGDSTIFTRAHPFLPVKPDRKVPNTSNTGGILLSLIQQIRESWGSRQLHGRLGVAVYFNCLIFWSWNNCLFLLQHLPLRQRAQRFSFISWCIPALVHTGGRFLL